MNQYILDENGNPVIEHDLMKWAAWFGTNQRRVAKTDLPDNVLVSTVFLGLDHNWDDGGAPVLWETMIFGGPKDGYQNRYTSLEDAKNGHNLAVALAKMEVR